eukprot:15451843-Alexandrium_andersonii.AAC.1
MKTASSEACFDALRRASRVMSACPKCEMVCPVCADERVARSLITQDQCGVRIEDPPKGP